MQAEPIAVGRIKGPHGIKGEVKILSLTDFPSRFKPGLVLYISPPLGQLQWLTIESIKPKAKDIIIKFENIDTREQAESLKGRLIEVSVDELEDLPEGEYWQFQIIGLEVYTIDKVYLGRISDILQTGANDVYVVKPAESEKEQILIPAVKQVVKKVDLEKGVLIVEPMPGLLEES